MKNSRLKRHLLSKMNSFDYSSMKFDHIIQYHNIFKFQNGPYCIMPSGVIALFNDNSLFMRILRYLWASVSHGRISSVVQYPVSLLVLQSSC